MNIAIIGTGYVGLVTGTCFADMGMNVTCVDNNTATIDSLKEGVIPIYEPGLAPLVQKNYEAGRLSFSTSLQEGVAKAEAIFIAVNTPPDEDGSADLSHVLAVAREIGETITGYTLVVTKSTVPVGTAELVKAEVRKSLDARGLQHIDFDMAANPEFLKEGAAIKDFMSPDRVVVGVESDRAARIMKRIYRPFLIASDRLLVTDIPSAEMIKYAANAMLATRISFMNDIANLCDLVGANVEMVRKGIGSDARIGTKFLYPGCGYGGSCFPKDVKAIISTARQHGYDMRVLRAVEEVNEAQKHLLFHKLMAHFGGSAQGITVALWGLAFKPETDDMRQAPALVLIENLLSAGANVRVYDPVAMNECRRLVGDKVHYADNIYDAAKGADAIMLVTEWKEFRMPSWSAVLAGMHPAGPDMAPPPVFDGRNIYDRTELGAAGFSYYGLGK